VELMVAGDTVTWPSGVEAKLVARHEQFWLTSESGKLFVSANVTEDGNGDIHLNWTDGSIWSRQRVKDTRTEVQHTPTSTRTRTIDSESSRDSFVSRAPNMFHKLQKTFGTLSTRDRNKAHSGPKASISAVQGKWIIDSSGGQVEVIVDGSSVSWSTGSKAVLTARNGQFMLTSPSGKIYLTGEAPLQGAIWWTNGSVWKRPADWAVEGKSSPVCTNFDEEVSS